MTQHDPSDEFAWNDIYTGTAADYLAPSSRILNLIDELKPGNALDVGCGAGGLVAALAERGWQVVGVDIAPNAIQAARQVLAQRRLRAELLEEDAARWRPHRTFDLITSSFALPGTSHDQARLFRTLTDALAPGGTLFIEDFDASMRRYPAFARFHCPSLEELRAAFDSLRILHAAIVDTAQHHQGEQHANSNDRWTEAVLHATKRPSAL